MSLVKAYACGSIQVLLYVAMVLCVAPAIGCGGTKHKMAHEELMSFHSALSLGATKAQVQDILADIGAEHLTLWEEHRCEKTWRVQTPLRVDELNWLLWIQLDSQDRVVALIIRISDDASYRPEDAPEDIVSPNAEICDYLQEGVLRIKGKF